MTTAPQPHRRPEPIAIVGVGAIMPGAPTAAAFWRNLTEGRYSVTDVPKDRWDPDLYYDPDPRAPGKTYSRIGGWVGEFGWDPLGWRLPLPPKVSEQLDDGQKWSVAAAHAALTDAGWPGWKVDPERVAVVIGNAIGGEKHYATSLRIQLPEFTRELARSPSFAALDGAVREAIIAEASRSFLHQFPEITEDTMPGELANIIASRIASLFNFRGPSFTTDAACASGLAGLSAAAQGLADGDYDAVVTGGVDRNMGVAAFVKFCKIGALSATGSRPFDAGADGFVMGEGAALFVLRRLADAERDGDRIYAVLLGIGGSSDGKGKGITAPNPVGQRLAIARAWCHAGAWPATVSCIEAHGTSTRVGDAAELESLHAVFGLDEVTPGSIALGSVKSNIGHLKAAAGTAGLFKMVMSLHEKVLPPSLNTRDLNPSVDWATSPFRVNTQLREWPDPPGGVRRGGVSAFGFGGTNFHAVLEEYLPGRYRQEAEQRSFASPGLPAAAGTGGDGPRTTAQAAPQQAQGQQAQGQQAQGQQAQGQQAQGQQAVNGHSGGQPGAGRQPLRGALVVGGGTEAEVAAQLSAIAGQAAAGTAPAPAVPGLSLAAAPVRAAIDYGTAAELADKAAKAATALTGGSAKMREMLQARGIFTGHGPAPKVAFLFTGQGSQYVNMLRELRRAEPIVAETFAEADEVMTPLLGRPLTDYIFTDGAVTAEQEQQLLQTEITQPAVLTADIALTRLLAAYGIRPDLVMGHSLGEYGALVAAGALSFGAALEAVSARGREMASLRVADNGAMAAVMAPLAEIERILAGVDGYVVTANINSTRQAVIGGATKAVGQAIDALTGAGYTAVRIPVSHAFHTAIVAPVSEPLRHTLTRLQLRPPDLPVVANVSGEFYPPAGPGAVAQMLDILGRQVASPVQFVKGLHTLYEAGARVFVEVGPKRALHGFASDVLTSAHDDVLTLFTNHPKNGDIPSFNAALCGLYAAGLGYPAPAPTLSMPDQPPQPPAAGPVPRGTAREADKRSTAMPEDRYAELGRLVADLIDRGRQILAGDGGQGSRQEPGPASRPAGGPVPAAPDGQEPVVITGAALGLPGTDRVFDDGNVARILSGEQFIDVIPRQVRREMADKHITRLVKSGSGDPVFETIENEADVIKLAGRYGAVDVVTEFGVDADRDAALDQCTRLAIGAGLDALRDAGIPLVQHYRTTTLGTRLPDRWGLPGVMRDDTGVVFASAFPGYGSFASELNRYHEDRARRQELAALASVRDRMSTGDPALAEVDRRIAGLRHLLGTQPFTFDRRFLFRVLSMGHSQFAEIIGARGPNTQVNAACASTAQALCLAEDWIRAGRCRRVVVVSADDAASDALLPWTGSGFLASGAAATDDVVEDAALPFDRRRHGMIIGSGAAALVVESAAAARERGIRPICELLAGVTANSAFHGTRLDVGHIGQVMEQLISRAEQRGVRRGEIAGETVFVSHETYTPARGGSASAEISALREVFGEAAGSVVIANTKGFTGHAMGAGVEEVVAVKALETGVVPPVPNFREIDPELGPLNLSRGGSYPVRYALRLAAGFGSQVAMTLLRWVTPPDGRRRPPNELGYQYRIADENAWRAWLARASGRADAQLEVVQRRLRIADAPAATVPAAAVPAATVPAAVPSAIAVPAPPVPGPAVPVPPVPGPAAPVPAVPVPAVPVPPVPGPAASVPAVPVPPVPGPAVPAPSAAPVGAGTAMADDVAEAVLSVVAGLTGYARDLLDLDLDLEADLGIDTVKQAEVFASVRERFAIPRDKDLKLRDFPTLGHVIGFVRDRATSTPAAASTAPEPAVARPAVPEEAARPAWPPAPAVPAPAPAGPAAAAPGAAASGAAAPAQAAPGGGLAASAAGPAGEDDVAAAVLGVVSDLTGYSRDLLDLDLDLEADLGIDTVKQAEVFASVRERFAIPRDKDLKLRDFPTLGHVISFVRDRAQQPAPAAGEPGPAAAPAPGGAAPAQEDDVAAAVLGVVSDLTGYSQDLLDLDLDLEADLGIDTVKQAEVFASVRERFAIPRDKDLKLRDFPTLGHVISFVRDRATATAAAASAAEPAAAGAAAAEPAAAEPAAAEPAAAEAEPARAAAGSVPLAAVPAFTGDLAATGRLPRRVPVPVLRPPPGACKPTGVTLGAGTRVVVMADEGGVADALTRRLGSLGAAVLTLPAGCATTELGSRLASWLADGPVHGLYWLPALDAEPPLSELDLAGWREALRRRVKNLYSAVRQLDSAGQLGPPGTFLVSATRLGGHHGYDEAGAVAPLGGAVTGFTKAYRRERPDVLAKAVDFPASRKTAALADALIEETRLDPGAVEIGRAGGRRWAVGLRETPSGDGTGGMALGSQTVYAVTGAAGAIVSAIVADLATAGGGGIFHLLDLVPEPDPADKNLIRYVSDRDGLKAAITERIAASGKRPTPVLIERELARYERLHSALTAIQSVQAAGGEARYHQVDLTDAGAVAAVLDSIRDSHGRLDVLLHAAGLDVSHALADKEPAEYDLVFDVKSDGLFNVLHAAGDLPIGAVVVFSSVAGRFGNVGQTDYSAANDLLCKVMSSFRRTRPQTRGIAVDWTAWGGLGMATRGSIPKVMAMAGIEMLDPAAGIPWIRRELTSGPFTGEVVAGGELGVLTAELDPTGGLDPAAISTGGAGPMVGTITGMGVYSGLTADTLLDPSLQPFLNDHRIDSVPVLPGVMGIEAFAELASLAAPDLRVADVERLEFLAPVKFYRDEPRRLTVAAVLRPGGDGLLADCTLSTSRTIKGDDTPHVTVHFTGQVRLTVNAAAPEHAGLPDGHPAVTAGHDAIYRLFFHGPAYQVLDEAWHSGHSAVARIAPHLPAASTPADAPTATEPRLAEACFQAAGLWEVGADGRLGLPAQAGHVALLHRPQPGTELFAVAERAEDGSFDCRVVDSSGDVLVRVDGYRTAGLDGGLPDDLQRPIHDAMTG